MTLPYTCPRCGHETHNKAKMRTHFQRKNLCPGLVDPDNVLTLDMKEHILANRIYKAKKQPDVIKHITIQNQQMTQINNYINKMDLAQRVNLLNIQPDQCSDKILSLVEKEAYIHKNDTPGLIIDDKHVEDLVGKMCRSQKDDLSDMNVLIDTKKNSMMIFEGDEWCDYDIPSGARQLVTYIHANFMNEHERYLLRCRNISRDPRERQDIKEQILKYYRIVVAFDLHPYCFGKSDDDIFDNLNNHHSCEEEFYPKFKKIKDSMSLAEKRAWCNLINNIVKANGKMTSMTLNKKLFELSQKDDPSLKNCLRI